MFAKDTFKGQVVLITGGGSGIGYTIAKRYLELGAIVWIASRKQERIDKALIELSEFGDVHGTTLDIRETGDIERIAKLIKVKHQKLDILINNAGGQFPSAAENISYNGFKAVINNNLIGTFYVTQVMAKEFFIPQVGGKIVNIIANIYTHSTSCICSTSIY